MEKSNNILKINWTQPLYLTLFLVIEIAQRVIQYCFPHEWKSLKELYSIAFHMSLRDVKSFVQNSDSNKSLPDSKAHLLSIIS